MAERIEVNFTLLNKNMSNFKNVICKMQNFEVT